MTEPIQKQGVENPRVVDLISVDSQTQEVVLTMIESRSWGTVPGQIQQLSNKFDSYFSYVLDGFFIKEYPQYKGKAIRVQLECVEVPSGLFQECIEAAENFASTENMRVAVKTTGAS